MVEYYRKTMRYKTSRRREDRNGPADDAGVYSITETDDVKRIMFTNISDMRN